MSKTVVVQVVVELEVECEDMSLHASDIVNELQFNFEVGASGAEIVSAELVEYETIA